MDNQSILDNKKVLVVDDEPDILETLEELLDTCLVDTAASYDEAIELLRTNEYDVAVLDIMGVKGYELLHVTNKINIPSLMLTAHALTPDNLKLSIEKGADAYVPKDKLVDIPMYIADVLSSKKTGGRSGGQWFNILKPMFDKLFGENWRNEEQTFWDEFDAARKGSNTEGSKE